ncbi:MAG: carboxypeptidase-like regulatory domain-containing protein, partial [Flavobacteriales bacterium]|nr:carboxypeptidase-like regulatory domain-containing protein [Flavobacteriales bacterium]
MRIVLLAIVVSWAGVCSAQSVSGSVLDRLGEGIPGAHVINTSKGVHAHTDEQGRFMVDQIAVGDTLKATHISFDVQYKVIDNLQEEIKFVLYEKPISLSEVVISPEINALELITSIDI